MIFGSKHLETAKLGPQKITGKSSKVGYHPLLVVLSIVLLYRKHFTLISLRRTEYCVIENSRQT